MGSDPVVRLENTAFALLVGTVLPGVPAVLLLGLGWAVPDRPTAARAAPSGADGAAVTTKGRRG